MTVVTPLDTPPKSPFENNAIPDHRLVALWETPYQPSSEELLKFMANHDFAHRIPNRPWNSVHNRQAQTHWDASIKSSIIHGPFPQTLLHRGEMSSLRSTIRPQAPTPAFNRLRYNSPPSSFEQRTLWHYSSFVQTVWGSAFPVLPERFMIDANATWQRLLEYLEAYHVYRGHGWRCLSEGEQRRETRAYALAIYESTIWQLSRDHSWADTPLSVPQLINHDIVTTRYQAMAHLALATLTHCFLCAYQK